MGGFEKPIIHTSDPYKKINENPDSRSVYYGEVISIDDETDGGRIKVRIPSLDNGINNDNLSWSYPFIPKFLHVYPQIGEMVRVIIEDIKYPQRGRFWVGSIISQPHKIGFDSIYTSLSTTNMGVTNPEKAPSTYPDADGVYPNINDIGIIGKVNTDIILKVNQVHIRAGKHENDDVLKLNTKNPASISLVFEENNKGTYDSRNIISADKIALLSHNGNPNFKSARLEKKDRDKIFEEGHPIARGDVIVEVLNVIRNAIIGHIHGYSKLPADKDSLIKSLEELDFSKILQENIVIN